MFSGMGELTSLIPPGMRVICCMGLITEHGVSPTSDCFTLRLSYFGHFLNNFLIL